MKLATFLNIKTNYLSIGIRIVLSLGTLMLLFFLETLTFFLIYGSGASSSRIAELWYISSILNYLPISFVGSFFIFRIIMEYNKHQYIKFKTNLITLFILILLFSIKIQFGI